MSRAAPSSAGETPVSRTSIVGSRVARVLSLARGALRDIGVGAGAVIGVLVLAWLVLGWRTAAGAVAEDALELTLFSRLRTVAILGAGAAVIAAAVGVAEDRRSGRLDRWCGGPLGSWEYVCGRTLGWSVGMTVVVALLSAAVLIATLKQYGVGFGALDTIDRHHPTHMVYVEKDREAPLEGDRCLLRDTSSRLWLQFAELPGGREEHSLRFTVRPVNYQRRDDAFVPRLQVARIVGGDKEVLAEHVLEPLPQVGATVAFAHVDGPVDVLWSPGSFVPGGALRRGGLAVDLSSVYLEGRPRSAWPGFARCGLGLFGSTCALVAFAVALALRLGDVVTVLCGGTFVVIGFAREFLVRVSTTVSGGHTEPGVWVERAAEVSGVLLAALPDLAACSALAALAGRREPWVAGDFGVFAGVSVWWMAATLIAALQVRRRS